MNLSLQTGPPGPWGLPLFFFPSSLQFQLNLAEDPTFTKANTQEGQE